MILLRHPEMPMQSPADGFFVANAMERARSFVTRHDSSQKASNSNLESITMKHLHQLSGWPPYTYFQLLPHRKGQLLFKLMQKTPTSMELLSRMRSFTWIYLPNTPYFTKYLPTLQIKHLFVDSGNLSMAVNKVQTDSRNSLSKSLLKQAAISLSTSWWGMAHCRSPSVLGSTLVVTYQLLLVVLLLTFGVCLSVYFSWVVPWVKN